MLNQTLTAAYQELRAEMDGLQAEKAQEQYYASMAAAAAQAGPSNYDTGGYGQQQQQQQQADPGMWSYDPGWIPEEWDDGGNGGQQY